MGVDNPRVTTTIQAAPSLERRLGPFDGAAIIVSNVIGGGILFLPPQIAASVPSALMFLSVLADLLNQHLERRQCQRCDQAL